MGVGRFLLKYLGFPNLVINWVLHRDVPNTVLYPPDTELGLYILQFENRAMMWYLDFIRMTNGKMTEENYHVNSPQQQMWLQREMTTSRAARQKDKNCVLPSTLTVPHVFRRIEGDFWPVWGVREHFSVDPKVA